MLRRRFLASVAALVAAPFLPKPKENPYLPQWYKDRLVLAGITFKGKPIIWDHELPPNQVTLWPRARLKDA